jgi:hypothetical protein
MRDFDVKGYKDPNPAFGPVQCQCPDCLTSRIRRKVLEEVNTSPVGGGFNPNPGYAEGVIVDKQDSCGATQGSNVNATPYTPDEDKIADVAETVAYARGYADGMTHIADLLEMVIQA